MKRKQIASILLVSASIVGGIALAAQDRYTVKVPGGLAFSEFRGYEGWQAISISRGEKVVAVILGNPVMINAYRDGIPDNGKPVPDGAKMAKIHWKPKPNQFFPDATVPGDLVNVDLMVKDSKRFGDSGGWGYATRSLFAWRQQTQVRIRKIERFPKDDLVWHSPLGAWKAANSSQHHRRRAANNGRSRL